MNKEDLNPGYVVKRRNGSLGMVVRLKNGIILIDKSKLISRLDNYNSLLKSNINSNFDITEVYGYTDFSYDALDATTDNRELLWQEKKTFSKALAEQILGDHLKCPVQILNDNSCSCSICNK